MSKIDYDAWHSGPPPSEGWWPASLRGEPEICRFYLKKCGWSLGTLSLFSALHAAIRASQIEVLSRQQRITWRHRPRNWPARSRT